jgi:hypothetical protein
MTYNVEAARAERAAERTTDPFTFEMDGRTWTMCHVDDAPAGFLRWSVADYAERFPSLIVEPDFPADAMTVGDLNALVAAWLGATPGE